MSLPADHGAAGPGERRGVRPGALSALLVELGRAPSSDPGRAALPPLRPGDVVADRFELVRELGRGGFGVVFEARDRALNRAVAFKAVALGHRPDLREERLLREAEAAARLSHPNVVTLHDVGRTEHGPFLVLELLRGRTLGARLEEGALPVREALRVARDVARALAHAHASGVVHRDLSPANVFLCDDGAVKVLDLGMAHAFGARKLEGGTPAYMAPEQRRGAPEDERTDVFALGVLLHHMLSGTPPFAADGGRGLLGAFRAPPLEVPGAPSLGPLLAELLEEDPVRRPRDGAAALARLEACEAELSRSPLPAPALRARRRPRARVVALVVTGVVAGAAAALLATRGGPGVEAPARAPSIAVLPFADLSPGRDQEHFSDGLAEEILGALAQVEGLRVAGRSSSFSFKGRAADLRAVGRELGVTALLEGSVRTEGNRVRVHAELVSAEDGFRLWSQTFDRELTGIFAVQDEIARAVVHALAVRLVRPQPTADARRTADPEVYAQYLLGRQLLRAHTDENVRRAAAAFERALERDARYAPAWAGLADARYWLADQADGVAALVEGQERAIAAAEKAVELDPALAEGWAARAELRAVLRHDWEGAQRDFERALSLRPGDSDVHRLYASAVLAPLGRLEDALRSARTAVELDPLSPVAWSTLGRTLFIAGRLPEAEVALERSLEVLPEQSFAAIHLAFVRLAQRRPAEALEAAERSTSRFFRLMCEAMARTDLGDDAGARRALDEMISRHGHMGAFQIAIVLGWRGDADGAFEWLERAHAQRDPGLVYLKASGNVVPLLRRDPRYAALLRKLNLPVD